MPAKKKWYWPFKTKEEKEKIELEKERKYRLSQIMRSLLGKYGSIYFDIQGSEIHVRVSYDTSPHLSRRDYDKLDVYEIDTDHFFDNYKQLTGEKADKVRDLAFKKINFPQKKDK